jgi:hypothetical protein
MAGLLIGSALLWLPTQASAQSGVVGDLLNGFGVIKKERPEIDYKERAPLAIPPSRDLPPPEQGVSAATNPNWPVDPDVARREKAYAEKNRPAGDDQKSRMQIDSRMTPDELRQGRVATPAREYTEVPIGNREDPRMSPDELRAGAQAYRAQNKQQKDLSQRPRLSDPPVTYLQPSPNAPLVPDGEDATAPGQKKSWMSKLNPFD